MIKAHLKSWKKAFEKDHLRIKKQNEWFDDFKKTNLYQQKKYKRVRNTFICMDYLILSFLFFVVYTLPVSELNALFASHLLQESYQLIVLEYTILILILDLFIVSFLLSDKLRATRAFTTIMTIGLFGGVNMFLLAFSFIIRPAYLLIFAGMLALKVVLRKWKEGQLEIVQDVYMKAAQDNLISHYNSKGILFEMLDEPQIRRAIKKPI